MKASRLINTTAWYSFIGLSLFALSFVVSIFTGQAAQHPLWNIDSSIAFYISTIIGGAAILPIYKEAAKLPKPSTVASKKLHYT